jgi:thioredoxin 1
MEVKELSKFESSELPEGISVVKFSAKWCGPCKVLAKEFPTLEGAELFSVDIEEDEDATLKYGIRNVPTTLIFKGGELVDRVVGPNLSSIQTSINDRA